MKKGNLIPYIIIISFVAFATFVGSFIFRAVNTPVNLESEDYYQKEIAFQSHIDKVKRSKPYSEEFNIKLQGKQVVFTVPNDLISFQSKIHLFRPSDNKMDKFLELRLDTRTMNFDISTLQKGIWMIKIDVEKGKDSYYFEESIEIFK
jgi:nitrogen fixation protein FixH